MSFDQNLKNVRTELIHSIFTALSILGPLAVLGSISRAFSIELGFIISSQTDSWL